MLTRNGTDPTERSIDPPIENAKEWIQCRLVVDRGNYSAHVNGRKVYFWTVPKR